MKMKLMVLAILALLAGPALSGGPQVNIAIGTRGGWCPPVRPIAYCPPSFVYRSCPVWYAAPPVAFYNWGPSVVVSSVGYGEGFSNVSPVMNYTGSTPVYQVPAPVIQAQPVTVYPSSPFSWKR